VHRVRGPHGVRVTAVSSRGAGRLESVKDVVGGTAVDARVIPVRGEGGNGGGEGGRVKSLAYLH
jgi:hypothetical protein